jgi:hypothetical protein
MKIKLTYTADEGDILTEAAFLLSNLREVLDSTTNQLNKIIENLRGTDFNSDKLFVDIDDTRRNLAKIDLRLLDVSEIILAYKNYQQVSPENFGMPLQEQLGENKDD